MKTKILLSIFFVLIIMGTSAQPAPPSTPSGNPVPVENIFFMLILGVSSYFISKKSKKE